MPDSKRHEPPEAIAAFLAERLDYLHTHGFGGDIGQRHSQNLLRILCRAAHHGRMPQAMLRRYEGLLKRFRPRIMTLLRSGQIIPPALLAEVQRVHHESRSRRPVQKRIATDSDRSM